MSLTQDPGPSMRGLVTTLAVLLCAPITLASQDNEVAGLIARIEAAQIPTAKAWTD